MTHLNLIMAMHGIEVYSYLTVFVLGCLLVGQLKGEV